jgi:NAD(P)-dependent dehydrogenase (short-subunit alcohol dehydrogenase family)
VTAGLAAGSQWYGRAVKLRDKVVVVTGGGAGIGRAMVRRFAVEKPAGIVVADRDGAAAEEVAREVGAIAVACDVGREAEIGALVAQTRERYGRIDVFVSNAGVAEPGGVELPDASWQRAWDVNVMAHVWAARAVVDEMVARGSGYLVSVASAAGLLSMIGAAPYTATKHAVVGLAEWLAITYGDRGVRVSCVCPQFVQTAMLDAALTSAGGAGVFSVGAVLPLAPPRGRHLRAEEGCRSRSLDRGDAQAARLARRGAPRATPAAHRPARPRGPSRSTAPPRPRRGARTRR